MRGIPCITSNSGGLPEANLMPEFVVKTPAYFDATRQRLYEGMTVREVEDCNGEPETQGINHEDFEKEEDHPIVLKIVEATAKSLEVCTREHSAMQEIGRMDLRRYSVDSAHFPVKK